MGYRRLVSRNKPSVHVGVFSGLAGSGDWATVKRFLSSFFLVSFGLVWLVCIPSASSFPFFSFPDMAGETGG